MRFQDRVWRHIPRGAHPLDFSALISAAGRWNRAGTYGCLYTSTSAAGAAAEYRKHFVRRGLGRERDLVGLSVDVRYVLDLPEIVRAAARAILHPTRSGTTLTLPLVDPRQLLGDGEDDLEHCRALADWARRHGFLAVLAPSAAPGGADTLAIYPENRPRDLRIAVDVGPLPLNYGPDAFVGPNGAPLRPTP